MDRSDVVEAARRIEGKVVRTPVLRCAALDEIAGADLFFKCENLQHIGAFKARGAMHTVGRLSDEERARGIITYSSGNHAQAVALAAKQFGISAEIAMPVDAPKVKVQVVESLGATITFAGTTSTHRHEAALAIAERTGGVIVEPFDHPHIIAGQGTATLELLEQAGDDLDALIVPVGGGGLLAGACLAASESATKIYTAEPLGCDAFAQSMAAGKRVPVEPGPTIADGLKPTMIGALNFDVASPRVAGCYTVDDDELARAVALLAIRAKVVVEPSGAASVAVALRGQLPGAPRRVGVLISGGNIAPELLSKLVAGFDRK